MSAFIIRCASIALVGIGVAVAALGSTTTTAEAFYYNRAQCYGCWSQAAYYGSQAYYGQPTYYYENDRNVSSPFN